MFFTSTRDNNVKVTASKAIADGISPDGGLYIPESIPQLSADEIKALCGVNYKERAKKVLGLYLTDFTKEELDYCVEGAYKDGKFDSEFVAPVVNVHDNVNILELFVNLFRSHFTFIIVYTIGSINYVFIGNSSFTVYII